MMDTHYPFFSDFSEKDIDRICDDGITRTYKRNCFLFNEGDESDAIYFIRSGRIKVFVTDENGKEKILRYQGEGEYFGELALIDKGARSASVETTMESRITAVQRTRFMQSLRSEETLATKFIRALAQRVRLLTEDVKNLALQDSYARTRDLLYKLATQQSDGTFLIAAAPTQREMAEMIGLSREMVTRHISDLKKAGYIAGAGQRYVIKKPLP